MDKKAKIQIGVVVLLLIAAGAAFFWPRGGSASVPSEAKQAAQEADKAYEDEVSKATPTQVVQPAQPSFSRKAQPGN